MTIKDYSKAYNILRK